MICAVNRCGTTDKTEDGQKGTTVIDWSVYQISFMHREFTAIIYNNNQGFLSTGSHGTDRFS